ncbi:MAG: maltose alpha-D-glucosyltransferase [Deinococcota bacterium]|jgi:maltose alpha-D-glucosyltransferase/alpha-amylase|nr:maltose alpha-D-glucosyltransferase [Deinococcota bacterium]
MDEVTMDPLWHKDAVIYELHVRSFYDSNNDGYGDFAGLREKLPYLEELGVNTLWLLPFYQSPLRDDGYDIADYYQILPVHGTLDDFKAFLDEAHARGMRVVTELVLNHTSDQHPWFQEARVPGSAKRDWYVWSDSAEKYKGVRIIFKDTEYSNWTWDPVAGAYYWHRFFGHQPDLNWDNPAVEKALHEVMFYWFDLGVDGLRLDAVPYLYEREGTSCENLPETLDAIKRLRKAIEDRYGPGKILLAEANQWPEDTVPYFGEGGEGVQMAFNFPLMPRMYLAVRRENRQPIVEMLGHTEEIPEEAQWALFLRNHDELTLEMVTDEERDFMYYEYAADPQFRLNLGIRRRLAPLLGGERRRIELMNALLLSLPGSPILYYGDEIGMGDNTFLGDRNGVRTPMQWSPDKNAGFSRAPFHTLFLPPVSEGRYSYQFVNVESERNNPYSFYHFTRRLIALRGQHARTFGRGSLRVLDVENPRVFAFLRQHEGETILVVTNLSRFAQAASLPLADFSDCAPVELFSQAPFPPITAEGYPLTLGPHSFYWFVLRPKAALAEDEALPEEGVADILRALPVLTLTGGLETIVIDTMVQGESRKGLERLLPGYLRGQRWFGAKERPILSVRLEDAVRLQAQAFSGYLALVRVAYEGGVERYFLPLARMSEEEASSALAERPQAAIARLSGPFGRNVLYDATADPAFWLALYEQTRAGWKGRSLKGLYSAATGKGAVLPPAEGARVLGVEQSNSSAVFGSAAFAKLYRRLEEGPNPEVEMLSYLTSAGFPFVPRMLARLSFNRGPLELSLGVVQDYLAGDGDAWGYALTETSRYLNRVSDTALPSELYPLPGQPIPAWLEHSGGDILHMVRLLGVRTAELHLSLAKAETPALRPEPTEAGDLLALRERVHARAEEVRLALTERGSEGRPADDLFARGLAKLDELNPETPAAPGGWQKIRVHGDYHLGQVLMSQGEYYLLDFEGEPAKPLAERRRRDQALRDVAGMLRSLDYAGLMAWRRHLAEHPELASKDGDLETWVGSLTRWSEAVFLDAYYATAGEASFLPPAGVRDRLVWAYQLDKALYEVHYELGHRPDWVDLPLKGLRRLLTEL